MHIYSLYCYPSLVLTYIHSTNIYAYTVPGVYSSHSPERGDRYCGDVSVHDAEQSVAELEHGEVNVVSALEAVDL